jgi:hypothetical protein
MKLTQTEVELRRQLVSARLDPDILDPWPAWKIFREFLHREVEDTHDAVSFQYNASDNDEAESDSEPPTMFWVRQFTERDAVTGEDELVGSLIVEFQYDPDTMPPHDDAEVWSLDYPDLEQWSSVVEGLPQFQDAINREPAATRVHFEEP